MKLHISEHLDLPIEAATQTIAILARKRVGKTYTASVIAEELIEAKIPIVVLDPTGAWWGLRSLADGKHEGYPVIIIGGGHADVPLEETAGKVIADLVVDHPGYYIIDFSQIESDAAIHRFSTDFAKRFYFRKEQKRFAMQLIIDEADIFIPQNPFADEKRMLGAFDVIVRRGGIRGIGCIMISQRPAVLNKNVLTQCETLIALQISGSQDVDAIEHWMRVHGTKEQKAEFLSTIGSLQQGVAWFWSPSWLQKFEQIHIRKRRTFNSSATPKAGEEIILPTKLAPVDIEKLGKEIKATIETQKANDPDELRRTISSLRRELVQAQKPTVASKPAVKLEKVPALTDAERKRLTTLIDSYERLESVCARIETMAAEIKTAAFTNRAEVTFFKLLLADKLSPQPMLGAPRVAPGSAPARVRVPVVSRTAAPIPNGEFRPSKCQRAILGVLATNGPCNINKAAVLARYTVGGTLRSEVSGLRTNGCIVGNNSESMTITDHGLSYGPFEQMPDTPEERIEWWKAHPSIGLCQRKVIDALRDNPDGLDINELAAVTEYEVGGTFRSELSGLRTSGVIVGRNSQKMTLNPDIFT